MSSLKSTAAARSARATWSSPWTSAVTCAGQRALRRALLRTRGGLRQRLDLVTGQEREVLQVPNHVAVVGVQPELIEAERRGQRRIEPDRARFGLAELHA